MKLLDKFSGTTILVIGDVMLDRYWWGSVSRISPEAPVPVVKMDRMTLTAGGAANVAANVAGLSARPLLVGLIGDDAEAANFPYVLRSANVSSEDLIEIKGRPTTVKTRIIAHHQQIARIDQETDSALSSAEEIKVIDKISALIDRVDAVIVSDYAKGLLSDRIVKAIIDLSGSNDKPVLVDPKGKDYSKYQGASLLTPNRREAADACGLEENTQQMVDIAGRKLLGDLRLGGVLITQGEDGMTLFQNEKETLHLDTRARDVYDVTGAGDTVIASLAVAIGSGADLETAAQLANIAAGIVVEQVGTTAIKMDELRETASGE